jgi:WD40 repeat protein
VIAYLFDVASGRPVRSFEESSWVEDLTFSPDGKKLATAGGLDGTVRVWDVASGRELSPRRPPLGPVDAVAFFPDGRLVGIASRLSGVFLWDGAPGGRPCQLKGRWGPDCLSIAFDGKFLTGLTLSGEVSLWQVDNGRRWRHFEVALDYRPLALSGDGLVGAFVDMKGAVHVTDVRTGKPLGRFGEAAHFAALSSDGKMLATEEGDAGARLWDVPSGKPLRRLYRPRQAVRCIAFSHDGRLLAGASLFRSPIHLLDVATGDLLLQLEGRAKGHSSTAFSLDGRVLASGGKDGVIELWEVATGSSVTRWRGIGDRSAPSPSPPTAGGWLPGARTPRRWCGT